MMNQTSVRSYNFLWLSQALLVLVILSFQLPIIQNDYWWCVRLGHETLASGAVPKTETFSWTHAGDPIVYQPWLACVGFWVTHNLGGAPLTYVLRAVLLGITYGLLWFIAKQESGPRTATILIILTGLATSGNWVMRTQLFAYPLFALCLYALFAWQKGNNRYLWILPVSMVLWSNLHGSFILALVLAGAAFVFGTGNRKPLLIALVLMLVGTLLTPHGLNAWRQVVFMLNNPSDQLFSTEWFPPKNEGWQANIFFAWILALPPLVAFSTRKLTIMEWILFLGFGWLAFSGIRYMIWFSFIVAILTAKLLAGIPNYKLDATAKVSSPVFNIVLASLFMLLPLFSLPGIRETWWVTAPQVYDKSTPFKAVEWLKAHPETPGPLWNDYAFGSYLIYALPSRPPWLDTRFFVYPPEQMKAYQKISVTGQEWEPLFQHDGINLLLLSVAEQPRLIEAVEKSTQWCEQYRDKTAVIFSRCTPIQ